MSQSARLHRFRVPRLYVLADAEAFAPRSILEVVEQLLEAGVEWIQLRDKCSSDRELTETAERVTSSVDDRVCLWINDRVHVAAALGVRRVHLGQTDLPPVAARAVLGNRAWIGLSTHDVGQAESAAANPDVDVLAVGPIFGTTSKRSAEPAVGLELVRRVRSMTDKPVVGIGGITADNARNVLEAGADCVAVISTLSRADDLRRATSVLLARLNS